MRYRENHDKVFVLEHFNSLGYFRLASLQMMEEKVIKFTELFQSNSRPVLMLKEICLPKTTFVDNINPLPPLPPPPPHHATHCPLTNRCNLTVRLSRHSVPPLSFTAAQDPESETIIFCDNVVFLLLCPL